MQQVPATFLKVAISAKTNVVQILENPTCPKTKTSKLI